MCFPSGPLFIAALKLNTVITTLQMIKHPHIVRLVDVVETDRYIGIVLEYASGEFLLYS